MTLTRFETFVLNYTHILYVLFMSGFRSGSPIFLYVTFTVNNLIALIFSKGHIKYEMLEK